VAVELLAGSDITGNEERALVPNARVAIAPISVFEVQSNVPTWPCTRGNI